MDLVEELMAAARELAESRTITQDAWSRALVEGWLKNRALGWSVAQAAGFDGIAMQTGDWERARAQIDRLMPPVGLADMRNTTRVWIANHARQANDALWDGRIDLAVQLVERGGKKITRRTSEGAAERSRVKRTRVIAERARDKSSDWKTCK